MSKSFVTYSKKKHLRQKVATEVGDLKNPKWELIIELERKNQIDKENVNNLADLSKVSSRSGKAKVLEIDEIIEGIDSITIAPAVDANKTLFDDADSDSDSESFCTMDQMLDDIIQPDSKIIKIGEASYSEVFAADDLVIKVIPVVYEDPKADYPYMLYDNLIHEFWVSQIIPSKLNESCDYSGFLKVFKAEICKGPYSKTLLKQWDAYEEQYGTENPSPNVYPPDHTFGLLIMENGGVDLEKFEITSALQLASIFFQISFVLAFTEKTFEFEHRDLHWGNILIKETRQEFLSISRVGKTAVKVPSYGIQCFIIDLTMARLKVDNETFYSNLDEDLSIFEADDSEDFQFTVYKLMKKDCSDWSDFKPKTNIYWLKYLLDKLVNWKKIASKVENRKVKKELKILLSRIDSYSSASDLIENDVIFKEANKALWS